MELIKDIPHELQLPMLPAGPVPNTSNPDFLFSFSQFSHFFPINSIFPVKPRISFVCGLREF